MNILLVSEYFPESEEGEITGGVEARCFYVAKALAKKHDVTVLSSWQTGQKRKGKINDVTVIRVGPHHAYSSEGSIKTRLSFANGIKKSHNLVGNADIVDAYSFLTYLPGYALAKKLGAKAVATYHEVWLGQWIKNKGLVTGTLGNIWEKRCLKKEWDKIISVSDFTKNQLIKQDIVPGKIVVIPNGIDIEKYNVSVKKYNRPTICCISRLVKTKRVSDLIKALPIIKEKVPNIQCRIIGDGPEISGLKKLVSALKLQSNVTFLGYLERHEDVVKELKSSHVFCLPSSVEGFGITVVEAMACEVPYVCSDIEPLIETTKNGKGGLVFKMGSPEDIAGKVIKLLENKKLYRKKQKEGEILAKEYEWSNISQEIAEVYVGLQ